MPEVLKKEDVLFKNDGVNVVADEYEVVELLPGESEKRKIRLIPVLPSEWEAMGKAAKSMGEKGEDFDGWLISMYVTEPRVSLDEAKFMRPAVKSILGRTVLKASGYPIDEISEVTQEVVKKKMEEVADSAIREEEERRKQKEVAKDANTVPPQ